MWLWCFPSAVHMSLTLSQILESVIPSPHSGASLSVGLSPSAGAGGPGRRATRRPGGGLSVRDQQRIEKDLSEASDAGLVAKRSGFALGNSIRDFGHLAMAVTAVKGAMLEGEHQ